MMAARPQTRLTIVNVKAGMPTVEQAKRQLLESLYSPRGAAGRVVKIIHGYGASGTGGAIRTALRELLVQWQREGKAVTVIRGEDWSIFDRESQGLRERFPFLKNDEDLDRGNAGVTIVEFPADSSKIFR